jgi:YegS/Rv2252/BmrU family lipid kinase
MEYSSTCIVINRLSRKGQSAQVRRLLTRVNNEPTVDHILTIERESDFLPVIQELIDIKPDRLIIAGGDGTLRRFITELKVTSKPPVFGIIPIGTSNAFARSLSVPLEPLKAFEAALEANPRPLHLGLANDHLFLIFAAIGISSKLAEEMTNQLKKIAGRLGYAIEAARQLIKSTDFDYTITVDGQTKTGRTKEIAFANASFAGTPLPKVSTDALTPHLVALVVHDEQSRLNQLGRAARTIINQEWAEVTAEHFEFTELTISTDPKLTVQLDGDVLTTTPVSVSVANQPIYFLIPESKR